MNWYLPFPSESLENESTAVSLQRSHVSHIYSDAECRPPHTSHHRRGRLYKGDTRRIHLYTEYKSFKNDATGVPWRDVAHVGKIINGATAAAGEYN